MRSEYIELFAQLPKPSVDLDPDFDVLFRFNAGFTERYLRFVQLLHPLVPLDFYLREEEQARIFREKKSIINTAPPDEWKKILESDPNNWLISDVVEQGENIVCLTYAPTSEEKKRTAKAIFDQAESGLIFMLLKHTHLPLVRSIKVRFESPAKQVLCLEFTINQLKRILTAQNAAYLIDTACLDFVQHISLGYFFLFAAKEKNVDEIGQLNEILDIFNDRLSRFVQFFTIIFHSCEDLSFLAAVKIEWIANGLTYTTEYSKKVDFYLEVISREREIMGGPQSPFIQLLQKAHDWNEKLNQLFAVFSKLYQLDSAANAAHATTPPPTQT